MAVYETEFAIGDNVKFAIKSGTDFGIITGISIRENSISYCVVWSNKTDSYHYKFELLKV